MPWVAFLRHAPTGWNRDGRLQGRTDVPLDDEARAELTRYRVPSGFRDAALIASPLARARETARILFGRDPGIDQRLVEMNWGHWEGLRGVDLRANPQSGYRDMDHWGWDFEPPGGEPLARVRDRVAAWLREIAVDTVAVTHIGVIRVALALATGYAFRGAPPFKVKRRRLQVIDIVDGALQARPEPIRLDRLEAA